MTETAPELPEIDARTKSGLERMKSESRRASARLQMVMQSQKKIGALDNGIGAWGGPIARQVKSPGQHNGLKYKHKGIAAPVLSLTPEQMNEIMKEHGSVFLPEWDHNFTVAGTISKPLKRYDATRDVLFKFEIKKFKTLEVANNLAFSVYRSVGMQESIYSGEKYADYLKPGDGSTCTDQSEAQGDLTEVLHAYYDTVHDLQLIAKDIMYKDMVDVSALREPPAFVEAMLAYVAVLLGLKPTWAAIKRALFKEIYSMLIFLSQVEPLTIPIKRLRAAVKLKKTKMPYLSRQSSKGVHNSKAFDMLAMWVIKFNGIALLILEVHKRLKVLNKAQKASNMLTGVNSVNKVSMLGNSDGNGDGDDSIEAGVEPSLVIGLEPSLSISSPIDQSTPFDLDSVSFLEKSGSVWKDRSGKNVPCIGLKKTTPQFFAQIVRDIDLLKRLRGSHAPIEHLQGSHEDFNTPFQFKGDQGSGDLSGTTTWKTLPGIPPLSK